MEERVAKTLEGLKRNHMTGYFLESRNPLLQLIESLAPRGQTIGCGDSATLQELGVFDFFRSGGYNFLDKFRPGLTHEEKRALYIANFSADTFISGANAITQGGQIVNIDGNGSRVAPTIYGPRQVIFVAGVNKIADSLEEAMARARNVAAPLDARRLGKGTPCENLGRCIDCHHQSRICNSFVTISGQFDPDRIKVILVNEPLGY